MENLQLKKGDTFLRISKYGRVLGVVESIYPVNIHSEECNYEKLQVKSTKGVDYDYNECYKVTRVLDEVEISQRKIMIDNFKNIKNGEKF